MNSRWIHPLSLQKHWSLQNFSGCPQPKPSDMPQRTHTQCQLLGLSWEWSQWEPGKLRGTSRNMMSDLWVIDECIWMLNCGKSFTWTPTNCRRMDPAWRVENSRSFVVNLRELETDFGPTASPEFCDSHSHSFHWFGKFDWCTPWCWKR